MLEQWKVLAFPKGTAPGLFFHIHFPYASYAPNSQKEKKKVVYKPHEINENLIDCLLSMFYLICFM